MWARPYGKIVWLSGLSGSGKSTICRAAECALIQAGYEVQIIDGDVIRSSLCADLGFTLADRTTNIDRVIFVANLLASHGIVVLVAVIAPLEKMRRLAREQIPGLIEVFVSAPLEICERRDPKGLYRQARAGLLSHFTGIDSPFEEPVQPALVCNTDRETIDESARKVLQLIDESIWSNRTSTSTSRKSIAVDFDGVIAEYDGWRGRHVLGMPRPDVLHALAMLREEGWKIIIHTTRSAEDIAEYLNRNGIAFDEINRNSDYAVGSNKPVATVYWDDRAITYSGNALIDLRLIRNFRTWNKRQ